VCLLRIVVFITVFPIIITTIYLHTIPYPLLLLLPYSSCRVYYLLTNYFYQAL
jgi:hypothetical protein